MGKTAEMPEVGSIAPQLRLETTAGKTVDLDDYRGRAVVLFFFPKASTPGWTLEVRGFRDAIDEFRQCGAEVLGVSADRPAAQARFVERLDVPFPMLCDPDGRALRAYGVRGFAGYARRASFLIDARGTIHAVYPKVSPSTHAAEVLKDLKALVGKC